jgi:hypothetical protein
MAIAKKFRAGPKIGFAMCHQDAGNIMFPDIALFASSKLH